MNSDITPLILTAGIIEGICFGSRHGMLNDINSGPKKKVPVADHVSFCF